MSFACFEQKYSVARHRFTREHLAGAWLAFSRGHCCSFASMQQGRSGSYQLCLVIHYFAYELHQHLYSAYQEPLLLGSGVLQHSDQLNVLGFIREIFSQLSADWSIWLLLGFIFFFSSQSVAHVTSCLSAFLLFIQKQKICYWYCFYALKMFWSTIIWTAPHIRELVPFHQKENVDKKNLHSNH